MERCNSNKCVLDYCTVNGVSLPGFEELIAPENSCLYIESGDELSDGGDLIEPVSACLLS